MKLGAHQSIAKGLDQAIVAAAADGSEALQIFSRNQSQWRAKPLTDEAVAAFREKQESCDLPRTRILVHDSYLINVAAPDAALRDRSTAALTEELQRCARLGAGFLVMHPGAHVGDGEARGLERVVAAITTALEATDGPDAPHLLIENTAGQGSALGYRFEHLRDLLGPLVGSGRVGICIDTQHTFAAGYDLSSAEGYATTLAAMDRIFGLQHVRAFHLNDSKRPLGARVDRHERIGQGHLGRDCFRWLLNDPRFAELPGVVELPPPCAQQISLLRRLADGQATATRRPRRKVRPT